MRRLGAFGFAVAGLFCIGLEVNEIFNYKDMKVTFTNGKVSNVE